jgi:CDP-diacylglycerol--glycerol-3-phosphate 3-phosphatidyltransferase
MNLPNRLTLGRLFVAAALFVVLEMIRQASHPDSQVLAPWLSELAWVGFVLFLIAAVTDFLDGYLARRRKIVSDFGRIADPFADKVLICGALVFLSATRGIADIIPPWVAVIVLAREFLVTGLRGYLEAQGTAFAARFVGKLKMLLQCFVVGGALFILGPGQHDPRLRGLVLVLTILTVIVTVYSGWSYLRAALGLLAADSGAKAPGPGKETADTAPPPAEAPPTETPVAGTPETEAPETTGETPRP